MTNVIDLLTGCLTLIPFIGKVFEKSRQESRHYERVISNWAISNKFESSRSCYWNFAALHNDKRKFVEFCKQNEIKDFKKFIEWLNKKQEKHDGRSFKYDLSKHL